jgi:hypothetical protein
MGDSDVQAHSVGDEQDDAACGIQLVSGLKPEDDVVAHSAGDDQDDAPCLIQSVGG